MKQIIYRYSLLLAVGLAPLFGGLKAQEQVGKAETPTELEKKALSEAELIDLALKNNGQVKARSLELKASRSLRATAFDLPKADVSAQYGHYDGPDNNLAFEISQTLPFPTLFWAKAKELKAGRELAEIKLASQQNKVRQAVRVLVDEIRHTEAMIVCQDSLMNAYKRCHSIIKKRRKLGEGSQQELTMASIKAKKARYDMEKFMAELVQYYAKLNALCGNLYPRESQLAFKTDIVSRVLDIDEIKVLFEENLELKTLNLEVAELKAKKNVSLSELLPDITLGYQNSSAVGTHTVGGKDVVYDINDRLSSFSIGLSIPLNLFSSKAKVKSARLQAEAKAEELKQANQELASGLSELVARYQSEKDRLRYYKETALPEAEQMLKLAEESYKLGEISYLAYAQALETYNEVKVDYINSSLNLNLCIINIYALFNK